MKFENKGKWFGESAKQVKEEDLTNDEMLALDEEDNFEDLLADDELDVADGNEQPMNEVRYIDPANLDKYDPEEIEEVTKADGTKAYKRKDTSASATKNLKLKQEKPKVFDSIQDIDPSKPLYKQKDYQYILNNLPKDPHAREAAFIQMGNKYKDPEQRRKKCMGCTFSK